MRSWLSEMASSVPSRPSYFLVTAFRSMYRPSASSPMATDTPPAPKSLQRLMSLAGSSALRNRRWQLALARGRCPSAPRRRRCSRDCRGCGPWRSRWRRRTPSRPVRPPSSTTTSPGAGHLAADVVSRGRAHHRADLHALGDVAGVVDLIHLPGGQADLVAVGGVAGGGGGGRACAGAACRAWSRRRAGAGSAAPVTRMA